MSNTARTWIWGGVVVLVVIFGIWWWYSAHPSTTMSPVSYGAPVASSTDALTPSVAVVPENRSTSTVMGVIASLSNLALQVSCRAQAYLHSLQVVVPTQYLFQQMRASQCCQPVLSTTWMERS